MARLSLPKTLEVGSFVGTSPDDLFFRLFEKVRGEADTSRTFVCHWDGATLQLLRQFERELCDLALDAEGTLHALGKHGEYDTHRDGQWAARHDGFQEIALLLRLLPGGVYALGVGAVHRFHEGAWTKIELTPDDAMVFDLLQVGDEMVVCGSDGLLGRIDASQRFHALASGTPVNLNCLALHSERVLVCGGRSTLLELRGDTVVPLTQPGDDVDFYDLCPVGEALFIATDAGVEKRVGDHREVVHDEYTMRLSAFGRRLVRQGYDDVSILNADEWIDFPVSFEFEREPATKKTAQKKR